MKLALTINAKSVERDVEPRRHLADFLRDDLGLTGTHIGCEHGICGACTVVIDGEIARSCITYAVACDGSAVRTIEDFDDDALMAQLRKAFSEEHALQCGYCTPGMLIAARDLIRRKHGLSESDIRREMSGNLCRCTGYAGIVRAVARVMAEGHGLRASEADAPVVAANRTRSVDTVSPVARAASPAPPPSAGAAAGDAEGSTRLDQTIVIAHPRAQVWASMSDLEKVTACMPGAALDGPPRDGHVHGRMAVKLGPITATFAGEATVTVRADDYSCVIDGQGRDATGPSRARGRIEYRLVEEGPAKTRVDVSIAYALAGPLAQFGRSGLVKALVGTLADTFARNLEAQLSPAGGAAMVGTVKLDAGSLFWSLVRGWFARLGVKVRGRG
jgi:carbon-monoxide dehydrogenase small subunit